MEGSLEDSSVISPSSEASLGSGWYSGFFSAGTFYPHIFFISDAYDRAKRLSRTLALEFRDQGFTPGKYIT